MWGREPYNEHGGCFSKVPLRERDGEREGGREGGREGEREMERGREGERERERETAGRIGRACEYWN